MNRVIEQRVREAARVASSGREVIFLVRGCGDRKLVAVYGGLDHAIFTGGSSPGFEVLRDEALELFRHLKEGVEVK